MDTKSEHRSRFMSVTGVATLRLAVCAAAIALSFPPFAVAEQNTGHLPNSPIGGSGGLALPQPPGGGGGPCNAPPLPPGLLLPSHARGLLRETCGGVLRPVAGKPIEVILRVKQQPMFCDPNNIPPPYSYDASVAHGSTASDGTFDVEFFANSANINANNLLLELKVRIRVFADDGVTPIWETAYYGQGVQQDFYIYEDIIYCLTEGTRIRVMSPSGSPSYNAEVFVNGKLHPERTNGNGFVTIYPPAPVNAEIVARAIVYESKSKRGAHAQGSTQNWKYRAYITSLPLRYDSNGDNAHFEPTKVTDPNGAYILHLNREAAYLGLHLLASIEWDASPVELSNFASKMRQAGEYLYNATDGQMLIERVDVFDDQRNWEQADWQVYANASLRAHVDWPSEGFWSETDLWFGRSSWMNMSRSNDHPVFVHEFGHYGMCLKDEYDDDDDTHCAAGVGGSDPQFAADGSKASCMMYSQWSYTKICSKHGANPHRNGSRQGDEDCWSEIKRHFTEESTGPSGNPLWYMKTPVDRGVIVGRLPSIPVSDWTTQVEVDDANNLNLCQPVQFKWASNGGFANGARVFSKNASGRTIIQGITDATGVIKPFQNNVKTIAGLHTGDTVGAAWTVYINGQPQQFTKTRVFTDADCLSATVVLHPAPGQQPPEPTDQLVEVERLPFSLAAQIEPTATASEARVRVRAGERLAQAPIVRCTIDNETALRQVAMVLDTQSGDWIGTLTNLPGRFAIVVEVEAIGENGGKSTFVSNATMAAAAHDVDSELVTSDGTVELDVATGALTAPTQVAIGGAIARLPGDFDGRVISGPVAITTAGAQLAVPATLRFALPYDTEAELLTQVDPTRLTVMAFDEATGKWTELTSVYKHGRLAIDSQITKFGTFVLLEKATAGGNAGNSGGSDNGTSQAPTSEAPSASPGSSACGVGMASMMPLMLAVIGAPRRRRGIRRRR